MNPYRRSMLACTALVCTICFAASAMPQTATKPATKPAAPASAPDEPAKVTVLKPGDSPRTALRFHPTKGATAMMEMVMHMSMSMQMDQMQMPEQTLPPMRFVMRMSVTDVQTNGDFAYDFTITDAGALNEADTNPQMLQIMKTQMKPMIGLKGHAEMNSRGVIKSSDMTIPPNVAPMARQQIESLKKSMRQMVVPLPEEAVGPGAQWKVEQGITAGGMKLAQVLTMTLDSLKGDKAEMSMQIKQSADPQDVTLPDLPENATAQLNSLSSSGEGKVSMDLSAPLAPHSEADTSSDIDMDITMQGQSHKMIQHLEIKMVWQEAKASETKPATQPATKPGAH